MAEDTKAPEIRASLISIAVTYDDLAGQVEWLTKEVHWPPPNSMEWTPKVRHG